MDLAGQLFRLHSLEIHGGLDIVLATSYKEGLPVRLTPAVFNHPPDQ